MTPAALSVCPGLDSVVIKKHHLVSVVVPVLLVLVVLVVAVAVFVHRHRRLRHRFLAFVSTHYSARPAAARFTNGDGLGEWRGWRSAGTW